MSENALKMNSNFFSLFSFFGKGFEYIIELYFFLFYVEKNTIQYFKRLTYLYHIFIYFYFYGLICGWLH